VSSDEELGTKVAEEEEEDVPTLPQSVFDKQSSVCSSPCTFVLSGLWYKEFCTISVVGKHEGAVSIALVWPGLAKSSQSCMLSAQVIAGAGGSRQ